MNTFAQQLSHRRIDTRGKSLQLIPILILGLLSGPPLAFAAQDKSARALPDIIVTAEKIERPLEKVPASMTVLNGWDIEQAGTTSLKQLEGRIPGLSFQPFGQAGMNAPVMRGLTANFNSFSTSTLLLVDGVPMLTAQGFESDMLDLDRIEVLRGPQSTLYGRNAESGVIAIYSKPMDDTSRASVSAETGSRNKRALRFALSQPLVEDQLYGSISGSGSRQDGFINNTWTGHKEDDRKQNNLNLGLRWTPGTTTDMVMRYTRQAYNDGANLWGSPRTPGRQVASGTPGFNHSEGQTLSFSLKHELAPDLRLHSMTAWNDFKDRAQQDTDFMPRELMYVKRDNHLRTLSQELRLEGKMGESSWLAGVYGDRSDNDLHSTRKSMMSLEDMRAEYKSNTAALFTHWNVPLYADWSISTGARIERDSITLRPRDAGSQEKSWTHVSPKLALQNQLTANHLWYVSASRGVRTGGFNVLAPAMNYMPYDPEKNWSYETGLKGWLFDNRIRYSLATYLMDIKGMQVMQMPTVGVMYIASAATATSKGAELDLDYLIGDGWQLKSGVAWNQTRYDRFQDGAANYNGKHNTFAPDLTGHIGIRYDAPQGWYMQAGVTGSSKVYLDAANRYVRSGYGLVNLVAGYQHGDWEITTYVDNATNQRYDAVGYQNGFITVYSPPREAGLRLSWRL